MDSSSNGIRARLSQTARKARRMADKAAERTLNGAVNAWSLIVEDHPSPVGSTESALVLKDVSLSMHYIAARHPEALTIGREVLPSKRGCIREPVLMIPPLMVQPYVYDLRPGHSLVEYLAKDGFDVFVADFGEPRYEDRYTVLDDYIADYLPEMIERAKEVSGARKVTLLGYSLGGIFALIYAAYAQNRDLANIVTIGSPVNFSRLGPLHWLTRAFSPFLDRFLSVVGNVPGVLPGIAMRMTAPVKTATRFADLLMHLYNDEYIHSFESIHRWASDFIPYPREAFRQFVKELMRDNKLIKRQLTVEGKPIDLSEIKIPILAFAGSNDQIAPISSVQDIVTHAGTLDVTVKEVPGGHIGIISGSRAPDSVWLPVSKWLRRYATREP